ncbi:MAG: phage minor capsid protein [Clostridia bacterium]|nr:phage minor capsid protein [Clostridia bacterium]
MTPQEQRLERLLLETQHAIMQDVVRRIRRNAGQIGSAADWQLDRLNQLGESKAQIRKLLKKLLKLSDKEINALFRDTAKQSYVRSKALYEAQGKSQPPIGKNDALQQLVDAAFSQTQGEFRNLTGSLGFAVYEGGKLVFQPIAEYYQHTLDRAVADVASGAFDYTAVLNRTVGEMVRSGVRTVDYATGYHCRIETAARRAVLTGLNQITGKVQERNAEALGTEYFETSFHMTARPTHQPWQGRVYSKEALVTVCGLGSVTGLNGANCRHTYYPFIPGVSERMYTDEQLEKLTEEMNRERDYNGKPYTLYEATQRQRRLETRMRAYRQKIKLLEEGGDADGALAAKCKYRAVSQEYTKFSKAMGLPEQRERVTVDGLGTIGQLPKQ